MTTTSSLIFFSVLTSLCLGAVVEQRRNFLTREACTKNPKLVFCDSNNNTNSDSSSDSSNNSRDIIHEDHRHTRADHKKLEVSTSSTTFQSDRLHKKPLELVVPPPLPQDAKNRAQLADHQLKSDDALENHLKADKDTAEGRQAILVKMEQLRLKCVKFGPIVKENCKAKDTPKEHIGRCAAYFKDCSRFMAKSNSLYDIAHSFSSGVNLNLATVEVNGIPYYPINEEGGVGVSHTLGVPFGSWGGGFSHGVGVRDYWSQNQEAGANWYDGKYGYKNGWSVPLVQSLGIEGGQHNTVSVPLHGKDFGRIDVDNGYHVGGYYGHNDHVGVDWRKGNVQHTFGVGAPIAGAGFMTGRAVAFPGLDVWQRALGKK